VDPQRAHNERRDIQFVDVREPDEWRAGHIKGATHIPVRQVRRRLDELATDRMIVTVCRSGRRSGKVARSLRRAGYEAENLDGGMRAWQDAGLPFVAEDGADPRVA
jgi:rhodanese-related sulfurtransferase